MQPEAECSGRLRKPHRGLTSFSRRLQITSSLERSSCAPTDQRRPLVNFEGSRYSVCGISLEIFHKWNTFGAPMSWSVEYTDEFGEWYTTLIEAVQDDIVRVVGILEAKGPQLPFPYSSGIEGSKHEHMRELRIQSGGEPYRVFYAFDPRRTAILLVGGNKTGDDRFYEIMVPVADRLYDNYLIEIGKEGLI
ncbi:type II toxin-antitoxin system RelE/ParE family toxin [Agrobacterium sp. B1(2019)]|uniref:type II toxin-antitoxin system RelE/ParE family toxin n=1 Tax=Agrobacterium sp. B1(2019) TaxID=2607032 RepID=UPI001FEFFDB1|nr:type II toxin-antitoxin system RelE/ParE family toxin [Agrobacterium sp. B1(2019)]